jgi:hypothetical protein
MLILAIKHLARVPSVGVAVRTKISIIATDNHDA